jgi:hypothetical protein
MRLTVQLVIESGDGSQVVTEVATLEREALTEATLGLTLAESKTILASVQETMVAQQAAIDIQIMFWTRRLTWYAAGLLPESNSFSERL